VDMGRFCLKSNTAIILPSALIINGMSRFSGPTKKTAPFFFEARPYPILFLLKKFKDFTTIRNRVENRDPQPRSKVHD
jgi:hypothetical protein